MVSPSKRVHTPKKFPPAAGWGALVFIILKKIACGELLFFFIFQKLIFFLAFITLPLVLLHSESDLDTQNDMVSPSKRVHTPKKFPPAAG